MNRLMGLVFLSVGIFTSAAPVPAQPEIYLKYSARAEAGGTTLDFSTKLIVPESSGSWETSATKSSYEVRDCDRGYIEFTCEHRIRFRPARIIATVTDVKTGKVLLSLDKAASLSYFKARYLDSEDAFCGVPDIESDKTVDVYATLSGTIPDKEMHLRLNDAANTEITLYHLLTFNGTGVLKQHAHGVYEIKEVTHDSKRQRVFPITSNKHVDTRLLRLDDWIPVAVSYGK